MKELKTMPNETKKEFDPTMSFSIFGSWFNTMKRIKEAQGIEVAYTLFEAIAYYSMYYEIPDFEDGSALQMFWPVMQKEIDLSLKRRGVNYSSEEANERRQQVIAIHFGSATLN